MATSLGKELRKLRIDLGITLKEMADKLSYSSAFLSAIETGTKKVPSDFLNRFVSGFDVGAGEQVKWQDLVDVARTEAVVRLEGVGADDRLLASAFARNFSELTDVQKLKIKQILEG